MWNSKNEIKEIENRVKIRSTLSSDKEKKPKEKINFTLAVIGDVLLFVGIAIIVYGALTSLDAMMIVLAAFFIVAAIVLLSIFAVTFVKKIKANRAIESYNQYVEKKYPTPKPAPKPVETTTSYDSDYLPSSYDENKPERSIADMMSDAELNDLADDL